jgi:hypothetical protein
MLGLLRAPTSQTLVQVHQAASGPPIDHAEAVRQARLLVELEDNRPALPPNGQLPEHGQSGAQP